MASSTELTQPEQKLLFALLEHAFSEKWRDADDFLRHFPPSVIVESLASEEDVRVKLLTATTGMHERLARRKSLASGADDLGLALEEKTTTPNDVLELYPRTVQVKCLPGARLWQFLTEENFWADGPRNERATERIVFTLQTALSLGILSLRDLFDGIGFAELTRALPKRELEQVLVRALEGGRSGTALSEEVLLDVVAFPALVNCLSPQDLWERVVVSRIAAPSGFVSGTSATPNVASAVGRSATNGSDAKAQDSDWSEAAAAPRAKAETLSGEEVLEIDTPEEGPIAEVRERLRKIERLPRDSSLPLAVLTAIESMYDDLKDATSDDERLELMKEAFPNPTYLRIGILALIDLLDQTIDVQDPTIRAAEIDTLLKIVLIEERKRRTSSRPASLPPPPATGRARSLAPPPRKSASKGPAVQGSDSEVDLAD
jgi:hypothetical protein